MVVCGYISSETERGYYDTNKTLHHFLPIKIPNYIIFESELQEEKTVREITFDRLSSYTSVIPIKKNYIIFDRLRSSILTETKHKKGGKFTSYSDQS